MTDLANKTWEEARELFTPDAVAILPVASTEPHGPHLPLDTDVTIAVAQARRAAERLVEEGVTAFVLPRRAVCDGHGVGCYHDRQPARLRQP